MNKPNVAGHTQIVCLPVLGLLALWALRARLGKTILVYFDEYPLPAKALVRLRVPERWLDAAFSLLSGVRLKKTSPVYGFPRVFEFLLGLINIVEGIRKEMLQDPWVKMLGRLIGEVPAQAYFSRGFLHEVWPPALALVRCVNTVGDRTPLCLAWRAHWPKPWRDLVERNFRERGVHCFHWPAWYVHLFGWTTNTVWIVRALISGVLAIMGRGWRGSKLAHKAEKVVTEFIEASRMAGAATDSNYWEDGQRVKREDILYFFTSAHERELRRSGANGAAMLRQARARGFRIVELAQLHYSSATLRMIVGNLSRLTLALLRPGTPCLAYVYWRGWMDFLEQSLLFDNYLPQNYMHTPYPNGTTGPRLDAAVVTGLCRRHGSRSVGYQNRCIFDGTYEDSFNCYDLYLAWGPAWLDVLGRGSQYLGRPVYVGCLHNDALPHCSFESFRCRSQGLVISIFTNELGSDFYPLSRTSSLLETCIALAKRHPSCRFMVKTKDPEMVDVLLADERFRELCESVRENFVFKRLARHNCVDVILESDIVIASAWVTPGSDALILGKRALFFNEYQTGGAVFADFPDLVARSPDELIRLFDRALDDYRTYARDHEDLLRRLDPFLDGQVKARILDTLFGSSDERIANGKHSDTNGDPGNSLTWRAKAISQLARAR